MTKQPLETISYYDTVSDRYEWLSKNKTYYNDLKNFYRFHVESGKRVVEIGLGTGEILSSVDPSKGIGIDLSAPLVKIAREKFPKHDFHHWDAETKISGALEESLKDGVDYILLVNCVGHWKDIQFALNQLKPFCSEKTRIITNYYNFLWAPVFRIAQKLGLKMKEPDCNWLSVDDVKNLFEISGYRVVKSFYRCLLPVNFLWIGNFINRLISPIPVLNKLCVTHAVIARVPHIIPHESIKVSVIIPARNESGNIESAVNRMAALSKYRKEKYEIIFVEGNSTDDTKKEIERVIASPSIPKPFDVKLFVQTGKGKGDAVRLGFAKATGDLFLILDADLTVPPEDLPKFVDVYCNGYAEFVNGCRLVYKMEKEAMRPLNLLGNKFFSLAFTWLLSQRFKDTLCGTKVVSAKNYDRIVNGRKYFGDFDPFGDFDLIFGASKLDLEISEVPIRYRERTYGETNISRWKHGWLLLKMCVFAVNKIKFVK